MRLCPTCRALVSEYDSSCEYCGTELPIDEEFELAIKNAELILEEATKINEKSYKLKKYDLDIINRLESPKEYLEKNYSESELANKKISAINKIVISLKDKIKIFKKSQYRKSIRNIILISLFTEISIFLLCTLVFLFNPEDVESFVIGLPALIGLLLGIGITSDSSSALGGAIVGMIGGGLLGIVIFWLISTPFGQLILILVGTVSVILGIIFGIKKARKIWL